jgi:tetratricopeptide (TPR) repeat protein
VLDKSFKLIAVLSHRDQLKSLVQATATDLKYSERIEFCNDLASFRKYASETVRKILVLDVQFPWPKTLQGGLHSLRDASMGLEIISILCANAIDKDLLASAMEHNISKVLLEKQTSPAMFAFQLKALSDTVVNPKPAQKMFLALEEAQRKGNWPEVDKFATQLHTYFPEQPRSRLEFGEMCLRNEKVQDAKETSMHLIKDQPLYLGATTLLAKVQLVQNELPQGVHVLEEAESVSPGSPIRLTLLGEFHLKMGVGRKAEPHFEKALESDPTFVQAQMALAKSQMTRDPSQAMVLKHHAQLGDENTARSLNLAAVELARRGQFEKSIELYQICLGIISDPYNRNRVHFNLALAFMKANQIPNAEKALLEIVKVEPNFEKAKEALRKVQGQV